MNPIAFCEPMTRTYPYISVILRNVHFFSTVMFIDKVVVIAVTPTLTSSRKLILNI